MTDAAETSPVLVTSPADAVTQITLNRPEKLNAITYELVDQLHAALDAVDADHGCRAVVLTGAGRGFCAGLDLTGYGTVPGTEGQGEPQRGLAVQQHIAELVPHFRAVRQPIIAAINGPCAGGGFAMALASDIRVCSDSARFGTAFVRLGISGCDIGVSWLLPRLIGAGRAWELLLTGRVFDAEEADRLGLVTERVPRDAVVDTALAIAERIKANSPFGVWMTKEVMWSNLETGSLRSGIDLENRTQILASLTKDSKTAMAGFFDPEPTRFENR